ncbi:MAG: glycosyltransferase family 39 protein [Albidovulum sp.]|uniref:glycosyltransferase family 39 protein n=1 Tax=Albidovulum sp. TaxID=1872424 RepID=UPI003CC0A94B
MTDRPAWSGLWGNAATIAAPLVLSAALFLPIARELAPLDRWAVSVLAVALLVLGFAFRRGAVAFGVLAFALATGTGAQLYLTEPLWFPTLRLRPQGLRDAIMLAAIAGEVAVAAAMLGRTDMRALFLGILGRFGAIRTGLFLCLTFAFSVPVLNYIDRGAGVAYFAHVVAGAVLICVHLAILIALAQVKSPVSGNHRISPIVHALIAALASLSLAVFAFEAMPHVEDEVAYLFQARTLAGGGVTVPAPDAAALPGLDYYLLEVIDGRWYSTTLPGWPAALAPALAFGVPWLLNPLLAALSVLIAHAIAKAKAGRGVADVTALLMAFSPWFIAAGGSLMPHMLTLFLSLLAWWMILRVEQGASGRWWRLGIAGLAMGWIFCSRPLDGVIMGGLTGLWLVFAVKRGTRLTRALPYALGCIAAGSLLLIFNAQITGSPFALPLGQYLDRHWHPGANAFGFGPDIGPPGSWGALDLWVGHGPLEAMINTVNLLVSLQLELFGWPMGSLALLFAYILWKIRPSGFDRAMAALLVVVIFVMALYWFAETYYFGPRYWFLAAFPIFYLSARGCEALQERLSGGDETGKIRLESVVWLLCIVGLCVFLPWRGVAKYHEYGDFHPEFRSAAATGVFGNAVVIFDKTGNEGSAFMLNDPWLGEDAPIFLHDTGTLDETALQAAFPGREILRFAPGWQSTDPSGRDKARFVSRKSSR